LSRVERGDGARGEVVLGSRLVATLDRASRIPRGARARVRVKVRGELKTGVNWT